MTTQQQLANHLRQVYFGGNWTWVNYQQTLADVTWQQATTQIKNFNTINTLVCHTGYYLGVITNVLKGQPLTGTDKDSFNHTLVTSEQMWQQLLQQTYDSAHALAALMEQLPDEQLQQTFFNEKYGNTLRNLLGVIEHLHYHLGQIVIIKKLIVEG